MKTLTLNNSISTSNPRLIWGVLFKLLSCLGFSLINVGVRYLNGGAGQSAVDIPSSQIAFMQYAFGLIFMLPWIMTKKNNSLKSDYYLLHFLRVGFAVLGVILWYVSLFYLPVVYAIALGFLNPIFTILGAKLYLQENMGKLRITAIILSFLGALIILRPDKVLFSNVHKTLWPMFLPILSAACFAMCKLVSRRLAKLGESPHKMTLYLLLFIAPILAVPALINWVALEYWQVGFMIGLGFFSTFAQFSNVCAYRFAEVTFLNPFGFFRIIFSAMLAFVLFQELPQSNTWWIGISFIISAIIFLMGEKRALSF